MATCTFRPIGAWSSSGSVPLAYHQFARAQKLGLSGASGTPRATTASEKVDEKAKKPKARTKSQSRGRSRSGITRRSAEASPAPSADQLARDRQLLDLGRPAAELHELRVARQALHLVLLHVAVAAEDVDRLHGDLGRRLAAVELPGADVGERHRYLPAGEKVGEGEVPHVAEEPVDAREPALHELEVADRLPELLALLRVFERQLEGAVGEPEGERGHAGALVGEAALHVVALLNAPAEQVRARDADVVQVDGTRRRGVRAHLAEGLRDLEPHGAALDEEGLDVPGAVLDQLGVDDEDVGVGRVRDERLLALDDVAVAVGARRRDHRAERVGAGARLGETPGA